MRRWMIMVLARDGRRRRTLLGCSLCLAAVLAVLVGGISRADLSAHHRSPAAAVSWAAGDGHGASLRLDQPNLLAASAVVLLAALVLVRRRATGPTLTRCTAHSPAPRGPPGQAR